MSSLKSEASMGTNQPLERSEGGRVMAVLKVLGCPCGYSPFAVVVPFLAYLFTSEAIIGASEKPEPG